MPAPTLSSAPPAPLRSQSPAVFTSLAEAFVDWWAEFPDELNDWAEYWNTFVPGSGYAPGGTDVALADGGTGASLTDPNADRILFWDDSAGAMTWLALGTGLAITGTTLDNTVGAGSSVRPIAFFFTTVPTASEVLCLYTACESITLADDFANSVGDVGTNPTSSFAMDVQKNGSSVGTITISTGGAFTFVTSGTTVSLAAGDQLKVVAPGSADATCANVSVTFKGAV